MALDLTWDRFHSIITRIRGWERSHRLLQRTLARFVFDGEGAGLGPGYNYDREDHYTRYRSVGRRFQIYGVARFKS
jgi:hypothetical protein